MSNKSCLLLLCVLMFFPLFVNAQEPKQQLLSDESKYGNNAFSLAILSANNKGLNFGFSYERFLDMNDEARFSFYIPVLYNSHAAVYHEREKYAEKNVGVYLGLKYYTAGSHAPVRYALGILFGHIESFRHTTEIYYPGPGGNLPEDKHSTASLTGCMFHNSLNVFSAKKFTFSMELDLGLAAQSGSDDDQTLPFALFQMSFGYRF